MSALITIGIPCFNSARWIAIAVKSALAQTWEPKEIIAVDDGSTDGSLEILRNFGGAIRLVQTEHRGANHARNAILREARGEWIQHLDADDYLLPGKISHQLAAVRDEADVLYSKVLVEENGTLLPAPIDERLDVYAQWLTWQLPQTGGCLWRTAALRELGGWNEKMPCCQEHELYLRALQRGVRFSFTPEAEAVYRIWSDETLCRRDPRLVIETKTKLLDEMVRWLRERGLWTELHKQAAAQACFELARTFAKYDLPAASHYASERQKLSLFQPAGPAGPPAYRLSWQLLGFAGAERIASLVRAIKR